MKKNLALENSWVNSAQTCPVLHDRAWKYYLIPFRNAYLAVSGRGIERLPVGDRGWRRHEVLRQRHWDQRPEKQVDDDDDGAAAPDDDDVDNDDGTLGSRSQEAGLPSSCTSTPWRSPCLPGSFL